MWSRMLFFISFVLVGANSQAQFVVNTSKLNYVKKLNVIPVSTYTPPRPYFCQQQNVNRYVQALGLNLAQYQNHGANDPCNLSLPFGKLMDAVARLETSRNASFDPNVLLNRAYQFVDANVRFTNSYPASSGGNAIASFIYQTQQMYLYSEYFTQTNLWRSATLIHEAQHFYSLHHPFNDCPRRASCDWAWGQGSLYQPAGVVGAVTYQVIWEWWYADYASNSTPALKWLAKFNAQFNIDTGFVNHPGFSL